MKLGFEKVKELLPKIKQEIKDKTVKFLEKNGFPEDEADEWSRVDTDIKHSSDEFGDSTAIYIEVGAELSLDSMFDLNEELNPIIQKIDPEAYFEVYEPGITVCYIWYNDSEIENVDSSINLDDYDDGYVEMRDGEPNFVYDKREDAESGIYYSKLGDAEYGLGNHDYKLMRWKNKELKDMNSATNTVGISASAEGSASDFFSEDTLLQFADTVIYDAKQEIQTTVDSEIDIELQDVYIVDYNRLVIDFTDNIHDDEVQSVEANIDMDNISDESDLERQYSWLSDEICNIYYNEVQTL